MVPFELLQGFEVAPIQVFLDDLLVLGLDDDVRGEGRAVLVG